MAVKVPPSHRGQARRRHRREALCRELHLGLRRPLRPHGAGPARARGQCGGDRPLRHQPRASCPHRSKPRGCGGPGTLAEAGRPAQKQMQKTSASCRPIGKKRSSFLNALYGGESASYASALLASSAAPRIPWSRRPRGRRASFAFRSCDPPYKGAPAVMVNRGRP